MNLATRLNRTRYAFRMLIRALTTQKELPITFPAWRKGRGVESLIDFEAYVKEGYNKNELVYACITLVASNASTAPLRIWEGDAQERFVDLDHPLNQILKNPNGSYSGLAMVEMINTFLNLAGDAFVLRVRTGALGPTDELWLARPDRMRPIPSDEGLVGFVYKGDDGKSIPFLPDEVIHIKMPNPGDPLEGLGRGLPPLAAAALEVDVDNKATGFVRDFFKNAAIPYGIFTTKNIVDDAEIKRIKARLEDQYTGDGNWFATMILDADATWQKVGADISEIAWPDLRRLSEARICMAFKVPPIMVGSQVGLERSTFSNTEQAEKALWRHKIIVDNRRIEEAINRAFAEELGEDRTIAFDYSDIEILKENRNERFTRANDGVIGGWLSVNDARLEAGFPPVSGGNVFLRPLVQTSVPASAEKSAYIMKQPALLLVAPDPTWEQWGETFHKATDQVARAWELQFSSAARLRFSEGLQGVLAFLGGKARKQTPGELEEFLRDALGWIDVEDVALWASVFTPLVEGLIEDQAQIWVQALGIPFSIDNPEVQAFIADYTFQFADKLGVTTKEQLRLLIAEAQLEGWSIPKLRDELTGVYSGWSDIRAEMIARTETIRSSNAGAIEAYKTNGIIEKQWFTALDERVCPFCESMHGRIVATEELFAIKGETIVVELPDEAALIRTDWLHFAQHISAERYAWSNGVIDLREDKRVVTLTLTYDDVGYPPLHPNCRCVILPVVVDAEFNSIPNLLRSSNG